MVTDYFKGTNSVLKTWPDSVLKTMSHCAAHLQWDIRFVTRLNPTESLQRGSSECNT